MDIAKLLKEDVENLEGNMVAIDGSLLAFRASAAGEKRSIIATHVSSNRKMAFDNRTAFKDFLKEKNEERDEESKFLVTDFEIEDVIEPPEEEVSMHIANEIIKYILSSCQADTYRVFLDEGETFRHKLATVQEYKGNRKNALKPANLQLVKDHLLLYHNAVVVRNEDPEKNVEADDVLNFYKFEGYKLTKAGDNRKIISASFDKDDLGNVGWSFDFRKDDGKPMMKHPLWIDGLGELKLVKSGSSWVCKGQGRKFFYQQVVEGDTADNYRGRKLSGKRYSPKQAFEDLDPCSTDKECLEVLVRKYKEWYPKEKEYVSWDGVEKTATWLDMLEEHWALARMLRSFDDHITAKQVLDKLEVEYD